MYTLSSAIRITLTDHGAVALDIRQGLVLRLNQTASLVLEGARRGRTELQIIDEICRQFDAPHDLVQCDVVQFLKSLEERGLIAQHLANGKLSMISTADDRLHCAGGQPADTPPRTNEED